MKGRKIVSTDIKKSVVSTIALLIFGVLAFCGTVIWLLVLIPAAALVWFAATEKISYRSRN